MRRIRHFLVAADAFNREDIWKRLLNAGEPILVMDGVINLTISRTGIVLSLCTGDSPFNSHRARTPASPSFESSPQDPSDRSRAATCRTRSSRTPPMCTARNDGARRRSQLHRQSADLTRCRVPVCKSPSRVREIICLRQHLRNREESAPCEFNDAAEIRWCRIAAAANVEFHSSASRHI